MNRLFTAWVENVYHRRTHTETGMAPLARWVTDAPFPVPAPADLAEAFRWSEHRTVSKTALVSLHGNRYRVDPQLVGRRVELVFDPFDLTFLRVRLDGADAGTALPFQINRHSHPKARPEVPAEEPKPTTTSPWSTRSMPPNWPTRSITRRSLLHKNNPSTCPTPRPEPWRTLL